MSKPPSNQKARLLWLMLLCSVTSSAVAELSGQVVAEARYFPEEALFANQEELYASVSAELEYFTELRGNENFTLTVKPFVRFDQHDDERSHVDIREFMFYYGSGDWEWRVGIGKVFWGVTESQHLVDIINQTDFVEDIDGEDKLGQPMINISWLRDWGTLNFFVMPFFRERTFAGVDGRLRPPVVVDTDNPEFLTTTVVGFGPAQYESDLESGHVDAAIRWNGTIGDYWDAGLYYFNGTSRTPELISSSSINGPVLTPRYNQIHQIGLDVQATFDSWLLKLEAIARSGNPVDYQATVAGFEYTFFDLFSGSDLGLLMEYHQDSRGEFSDAVFQNDIFAGLRLGLNDNQSTELLAGGFFDLDNDASIFRLEASRRLGSNFKASVNAQLFDIQENTDPQYFIQQDDYIEFSIGYYF